MKRNITFITKKGEKFMCFYGCANRDRYGEDEKSETEITSYVKPFDVVQAGYKYSRQDYLGFGNC